MCKTSSAGIELSISFLKIVLDNSTAMLLAECYSKNANETEMSNQNCDSAESAQFWGQNVAFPANMFYLVIS